MHIPNFTTLFSLKNRRSLIDSMISLFRPNLKILRAHLPAKFFLAATLLFFGACNKESDIGLGLQPQDELLNGERTDTVTLWTRTIRDDSVRSDKSGICMLGSYNDSRLGKTSANLYAQFLIPNNLQNITFESGAIFDSIVLQLAYGFDYYGDTNSTQTFEVYRMQQSIDVDSSYYAGDIKTTDVVPIGSVQIPPRPRTDRIVGTDTVPPFFRIKLDNTFGASIFALSGQSGLQNNDNFLLELKGLYIKSATPSQAVNQGAMFQIKPQDSLTRLELHYHVPAIPTNIPKKFSFVINSQAAYFGSYTHDYSAAVDITTQLSATSGSFNEVFVQALGGLRTKIDFPFIDNWNNLGYNVVINKAELVIPVEPTASGDPNLPPNTRLYVVSIDELNRQKLLIDFITGASNFDGNYNSTTGEYRINMARYMNDLIAGVEPNNGLYLKEISPNENARRVVLKGGDVLSSTNRMKLVFTYTRIN